MVPVALAPPVGAWANAAPVRANITDVARARVVVRMLWSVLMMGFDR
jgi:hypothetical protein